MEKPIDLAEIDRLVKQCAHAHVGDGNLLKAVTLLGQAREQCELLPKSELKKMQDDLQKLKEAPLQYAIYMGPSPHDERDVLVGIGGARYEVRLTEDVRNQPEPLTPGQQVLLNAVQNVVAVRGEYAHGETAEVVNVLRPPNSAEVIQVEEENGLPIWVLAQWREEEARKFACTAALQTAKLHPGDIVEVDPDTECAIAKLRPRLHIRMGGSDGTIVEISDRLFDDGVRIGDLVRIEPQLKFAFEKLPSTKTGGLALEDVPDVTYDDIGGLEQQIEDFRDAVELPYLQRSLFARYQLTRPKGILLYGPPGCGKTMVAKAVANSLTESIRHHLTGLEKHISLYLKLQKKPGDPTLLIEAQTLLDVPATGDAPESVRQHLEAALRAQDITPESVVEKQREIRAVLDRGDGVRSFFLNIKGPELLDKYVGETEHRIRGIFDEARRQATYYTPVIIFFDEMEAMFRARGTGRSSDIETTIVPQFLAEIDGVEGAANVLLIGATNRDDMIDPAILRPGRLDVKIYIGHPNREAAAEIFSMYLSPRLPLNAEGLPPVSLQLPGNLVFRTAYAHALADAQEEQVRRLLPPSCDVRLALSFQPAELERLAAHAPEETLRQLSARLCQASGALTLGAKASRLKASAKLGDVLAPLREFAERYHTDATFTQAADKLARQEQLTESLIESAVEVLFSSSSYIRVITRLLPGPNTARYNFAAHDFVTGAVIASIVSRAKRSALKREVSAIGTASKGISSADLLDGIKHEFQENREQFAVQKLRDELGKANEELQLAELHLETGLADPWNEEKPRSYREPKRA